MLRQLYDPNESELSKVQQVQLVPLQSVQRLTVCDTMLVRATPRRREQSEIQAC